MKFVAKHANGDSFASEYSRHLHATICLSYTLCPHLIFSPTSKYVFQFLLIICNEMDLRLYKVMELYKHN